MSASREALAAIVRGDAEGWIYWADRPARDLLAFADANGMVPLVAEAATIAGAVCSATLRGALQTEATRRLAADLVQEHELRRVVAALDAAGVGVLLMKGVDLAYGAYPSPHLRPRTDSDLLVEPSARDRAAAVLESLGYARVPQTGGDLLMYQEPFRLLRDDRVAHVVDLHWRVFNPQRYGSALTFDDFDRSARALPALAPGARGLSPVHALALACVHRVAHHFDQDRLIWLYDVRLLASGMRRDQWTELVALAEDRAIQAACAATFEAARDWLRAAVPDDVIATLRRAGAGDDDAVFDPRVAHARRVLSDMRHVAGWRGRMRLARQHLFPPSHYMRTVYAPASAAPLWMLYARRIVLGSRRWLGRS